MNIEKYLKDSRDVTIGANLSETGPGRVYTVAGGAKLKELRDQIEEDPKIDTERLRDDVRYKLGMIAGIKFFMGLQEGCRALIKTLERRP